MILKIKEMIHAMNDVTIHRGSSPNLTSLDIYIDNEFSLLLLLMVLYLLHQLGQLHIHYHRVDR